ncbi:MAG: hypothetical protein ACD_79C01052G0004 [uncultured bacterium]|nr:MAG: hypothetical protein ACD_79C01052G0004 [uncultured bacterium]
MTNINFIPFWKSFIISFMLFISVIFICMLYIDPRGVFGTNKFPIVVATTRGEKMSLLKQMKEKPEILIFGNSHCMRFDPKVVQSFTNLNTFNFAVDSGKIEDFLSLLQYSINDLYIKPKLIILGISARTFAKIKDEPFDNRLISTNELIKYLPLNPILKYFFKIKLFFETLNLNYILDAEKSIKLFKENNFLKNYSFDAGGFFLQEYGRLNEANDFNKKEFSKDSDITGFSDIRIQLFKEFIQTCRQHGIKLKIIITPYDPSYIRRVDAIDSSYSIFVNKLLKLLRTENTNNYYEIYDYSRIENYGGINEFIGAGHPSIPNSNLILKKVLKDNQ